MFWPCETRTSTCLSFATISSGLYRFLAIAVLLDVKDIPQVGPLQWGWIKVIRDITPGPIAVCVNVNDQVAIKQGNNCVAVGPRDLLEFIRRLHFIACELGKPPIKPPPTKVHRATEWLKPWFARSSATMSASVRDQVPKPSCVSCQLGSPTTTTFTRTRLSDIVHRVSSSQLMQDPDRVRSFGGYNSIPQVASGYRAYVGSS